MEALGQFKNPLPPMRNQMREPTSLRHCASTNYATVCPKPRHTINKNAISPVVLNVSLTLRDNSDCGYFSMTYYGGHFHLKEMIKGMEKTT
jgi:hypothetical protein